MYKLLRTIVWISYLFIYMLLRMPYSWRMRSLEKQGREAERQALIEREVALWAQRLLRRVKITVEVQGAENLPPPGEVVVYASNHQSFLDIPVLLDVIDPPQPLLARKEIGQVPLLGFWMRKLGCVFVDRDDTRAAMTALKDAEKVLERGRGLIVFPEGTRSKGEKPLGDFQPGVVRIAWKGGARIVPVLIEGTYKGLEGNGNRIQPAEVTVRFLPPVETRGLDRAQQKALPSQLRQLVAEAKGEA